MTLTTVQRGENVDASVMGLHVPVPAGWEAALRAISPITDKFSHLRFYWYRAKSRWVLYDCVPRVLIKDDELQGAPILGSELIAELEGLPPRERPEWNRCPYVSDVQHEFYRLYQVYARPFWVLQGDTGGHQVQFSPWQQNVLQAKQLPTTPPVIGSLPPCPFDNRVIAQLQHLNRLHRFEDRLEKLQASGSREAADAEMQLIQREIREAECAFIEAQVTPAVEAGMQLVRGHNPRGEYAEDALITMAPGSAARAKDAYEEYKETGDFTLHRIARGI